MIRLLMRCGDVIAIDPDKAGDPVCFCGEKRIARTLTAPRPRIVGHARGPLVEGKYLGAKELDLTQAGAAPLTLKPQTQKAPDAQ